MKHIPLTQKLDDVCNKINHNLNSEVPIQFLIDALEDAKITTGATHITFGSSANGNFAYIELYNQTNKSIK